MAINYKTYTDAQLSFALKDIKASGKLDVKKLQKLKDGVKNKDNPNIFDIEPLSKEQIDILRLAGV